MKNIFLNMRKSGKNGRVGEWEKGRAPEKKQIAIPTHSPFPLTPILTLLILLVGCTTPETASHDSHASSPYVSEAENAIKALSAEEVDGYLAGAGMGFAKAAELNSYPGPKHVLELAEELKLTDEQAAQVQGIFEAMQAEAKRLGAALVEQERALDALFADANVSPATLQTQVHAIGVTRADVRLAHLNAHLETRALLSDWQVKHYDMVRGYADHSGHGGSGQHEHGM